MIALSLSRSASNGMDSLLFFGGLIVFFVFVAPIITFIRIGKLGERVRNLENQIDKLSRREIKEQMSNLKKDEGVFVSGEASSNLGTTGNLPPAPYTSHFHKDQDRDSMMPSSYESESDWSGRFFEWLKDDWLLKLGAFLILLGFGWFVTYAILNDWIGEMGRISLGLVSGALIMILGFWRINKYLNQGGTFIVLGSTVILLTTFAARQLYNFFDPLSALVIMFMSTALVAFASVRYQSRSLAFSSLILAGFAPLLTNSTDTTHIGLYSYLLVVVIGTLWVAALRGWRELITAGLMMVGLYSLPDLNGYSGADPQVVLLFIYAFSGIFYVSHTLGALKVQDKSITSDLVTASINGLLLLLWIWSAASTEWRSLIISAWMVVFAAGGFSIFRATGRREPFYIYLGVSIAMLAAATAAELDGAVLTIAYTIESALIPIISYVVLRRREESEALSFLIIGPILMSFGSLDLYEWHNSILNTHFFVLLMLALSLFGIGAFFYLASEKEKIPQSSLTIISLVLSSIYVFALIWLSLHIVFKDWAQAAVMISLVAYTIVGLMAYFYGRTNAVKGMLTYGGALLAFVIGRLLLVDVWQMELPIRTATFFLIGALLISTAFLGRANKNKNILNG